MNNDVNWVRLPVLAGIVILLFVGTLHVGGLYIQSWTMPWQEEIRRQTYEESRSHVEGVTSDIIRYKMEYEKLPASEEEQKKALRLEILRKAATLDEGELPDEVRAFVEELKQERASER